MDMAHINPAASSKPHSVPQRDQIWVLDLLTLKGYPDIPFEQEMDGIN